MHYALVRVPLCVWPRSCCSCHFGLCEEERALGPRPRRFSSPTLHMKWRREEPRHTNLPYELRDRELSAMHAVNPLVPHSDKLKNSGSVGSRV